MISSPDFANPPIVEMVLGAQFSPLTKLTTGHFGLFWKELGDDWTNPTDGPLIVEQFEMFDRPKWSVPSGLQLRLESIRFPGRFTLEHKSKERLLQLQATRFHLNWQKREGFYPSYRNLIAEFESTFAKFSAFAEREGIGPVVVNQWELTYNDAFPRDENWTTPADWPKILPGLFSELFRIDGLGVLLERRAAEWSFEIQPRRGRLHISAGPGRVGEDIRDALLLQMTARGPVGKGGAETLRAGLDLGHEVACGAFLRMVSDEIKTLWGRKQ